MSGDEDDDPPTPIPQRTRDDIILKLFVGGMSIPGIVDHFKRERHIEIGRDVPYQAIGRATGWQWLKYEPPPDVDIGEKLKNRYVGLLDVFVPSVGERMTVVSSAAQLCCESIYNIAAAKTCDKTKGIEEGDKIPTGDPWKFPVRVHSVEGGADHVVEMNLEDVDFNTVKPEDVEPLPMEIEVRIGFSGGNTIAMTTADLGVAIAEKINDWDKRLKDEVFATLKDIGRGDSLPKGIIKRRFKVVLGFVFVNLVAGFDPEPQTNPIAFLTDLLKDELLASRIEVKIFNAMPFVEVGRMKKIMGEIAVLQKVRDFYDKNGFDIILTSGSSISDRHSTFGRYFPDPRLRELLIKEGVQGDFLWLPITKTEAFSFRELRKRLESEKDPLADLLKYRPMTLLNLEDDVVAHVEKRRDVILVIGPCGKCYEEKSQVLKAVLSHDKPLVTHLVVDKATAEATLKSGD